MSENPHMTIGEVIRRWRVDKGWTQDELATRCGWEGGKSRIGMYERGSREPSFTDAGTIAGVFGVGLPMFLLGPESHRLTGPEPSVADFAVYDDPGYLDDNDPEMRGALPQLSEPMAPMLVRGVPERKGANSRWTWTETSFSENPNWDQVVTSPDMIVVRLVDIANRADHYRDSEDAYYLVSQSITAVETGDSYLLAGRVRSETDPKETKPGVVEVRIWRTRLYENRKILYFYCSYTEGDYRARPRRVGFDSREPQAPLEPILLWDSLDVEPRPAPRRHLAADTRLSGFIYKTSIEDFEKHLLGQPIRLSRAVKQPRRG